MSQKSDATGLRGADIIDERLHICFVAPHAYPLLAERRDIPIVGGAEVQQTFLARGLAERGYEVSMICLDYGQPAVSQIGGITVHRAFGPDAGIPIFRFLYPRLTSIWSCLKRANADIYYTRTAGMLTGVVAAFCKHYTRKSIFAAAGNPDFQRKTDRIRLARDRWIYEYGLRNTDALVAQNEDQVRLCQINYMRTPTIVNNCYPIPAEVQRYPGKYVLWVSTLRGLKRPEIVLEIAKALPNIDFVIIGGRDGHEPALFDKIESQVRILPNVNFVGFVPYWEVGRYFDGAMVFLNTSESEGFPNTFLQSWSRGIPTVSFIDCGARERGETIGRVVEDGAQMVEQIAMLMRDSRQWEVESQKCRAYYKRHHLPDIAYAKYEQIFSEILGHEVPN